MQVWTIHEIRRPEGQAAIEACCLLTHTPIIFRTLAQFASCTVPWSKVAHIRDDPSPAYI